MNKVDHEPDGEIFYRSDSIEEIMQDRADTIAEALTGKLGSNFKKECPMNEAWLETTSGEKFYLFYPERSQVRIGDIAHALSHLCRYNGHTSHFYSVAEHCVHVAGYLAEQNFGPEVVLAGLMHDAAEAYIGDIISPLKAQFLGLGTIERKIHDEIIKQLCPSIMTTCKEHKFLISEIDKNIVNDERRALMQKTEHKWVFNGAEALNCPIPCWTSEDAYTRFHDMFTRLLGQVNDEYRTF